MTGNIGTLLYMANEVLQNQKQYNESCDVYSFGIVMYELLFEKLPYSDENVNDTLDMFLLATQISQGRRPSIPIREYTEHEQSLVQLMQYCWSQNAQDRPNFKEIHNNLERLLT